MDGILAVLLTPSLLIIGLINEANAFDDNTLAYLAHIDTLSSEEKI
jgi:hypothetical protein